VDSRSEARVQKGWAESVEGPIPEDGPSEVSSSQVRDQRSPKDLSVVEAFSDSGDRFVRLSEDNKFFKCPYPKCPKDFTNRQGLGGHVSKKHPGWSKAYQKKIRKRNER